MVDSGTVEGATYNKSVSAFPPDDVAVPLAPRRFLWGAIAAGAVLLLGVAWAVAGRSHPPPVEASASPPASAAAAAPSLPPPPPVETGAPADSAPPAVAVAPAPAATPAPPAATSTKSTRGHRSRKPSCNPPFVVDPQGVKVPKPECFR
jgi:serine/threonine-protein kinase